MLRHSTARLLILIVLVFFVFSATGLAAPPPWTPPGRSLLGQQVWWAMFDLEQGTTYTYHLEAVNRNRVSVRGQLSFTLLADGTIRFWYDVGAISGHGTAPADPQALSGAVLLSAMSQAGRANVETLQLLAAPFYWVNWLDQLYNARFRNGIVWEEFTSPPTRFEAQQTRSFGTAYEGKFTVGRETVARMWLDLWEPLPEHIVVFDGRWEFSAQLTSVPQGPLLR